MSDSPLVAHARRELELVGEDPDVINWMVGVVEAYVSLGHSGGSHLLSVERLYQLLNYQNLMPLTRDPDEWEDRTEISGTPLWQNKRNPQAFSEDGGIRYYLVDETPRAIYYADSCVKE